MAEKSVHDRLVELMAGAVDDTIEHSSKEQLADTARILAGHVAEYQRHFGMLPANSSLATMMTLGTVTEDQALFIVESLENLISALDAVNSTEQWGDVEH